MIPARPFVLPKPAGSTPVPMYSCTHVTLSLSWPGSYDLRSWMLLPAASSDFLVTTSERFQSNIQFAEDDDAGEKQKQHPQCSVKYQFERPQLPPAGCSSGPPSSHPHASSPRNQRRPHNLLPRRPPRPQHPPPPLQRGRSNCPISSSARRRKTSLSTMTPGPEAQRSRPW